MTNHVISSHEDETHSEKRYNFGDMMKNLLKTVGLGLASTTLTAFLFGQAALAGDRTGSGGDALVCFDRDGKIESVELWDYVEAKYENNTNFDFGEEGIKYYHVVQHIAKKIKRLESNPKFGPRHKTSGLFSDALLDNPDKDDDFIDMIKDLEISNKSNKFFALSDLGVNFSFRDISDTNSRIQLNNNCKLKQIAIQESKFRANGSKIKIDKTLWKLLSESHKAGLIIHEVLIWYASMLDMDLSDTQNLRDLNSVFASDDINSFNVYDYLDSLTYAGFLITPDFLRMGYNYSSDYDNEHRPYFYVGSEENIKLGKNYQIIYPNKFSSMVEYQYDLGGIGEKSYSVIVPANAQTTYNIENQRLEYLPFKGTLNLETQLGVLNIHSQNDFVSALRFNTDENTVEIYLLKEVHAKEHKQVVKYQEKEFEVNTGFIQFHKGIIIKRIQITGSITLITDDGLEKLYNGFIQFNEYGQPI